MCRGKYILIQYTTFAEQNKYKCVKYGIEFDFFE